MPKFFCFLMAALFTVSQQFGGNDYAGVSASVYVASIMIMWHIDNRLVK